MRLRILGIALLASVVIIPIQARGGDAEIAKRISSRLLQSRSDGELVGFHLSTKVDDGTVWMTGNVGNEGQRDLVLDIARKVSGVKLVVNDLQIGAPKTVESETKLAPVRDHHESPASAETDVAFRDSIEPLPIPEPRQRLAERIPPRTPQPAPAPIPRRHSQVDFTESMATSASAETDVAFSDSIESVPIREPRQRLAERIPRRTPTPAPVPVARRHRQVDFTESIATPNDCVVDGGYVGSGYVGSGYVDGGYVGSNDTGHYDGGFGGGSYSLSQPAHSGGGAYGGGAYGGGGISYESAQMPGYAWPSYAAHPNYAGVSYPKQYSPMAWPYIGPFYPYPQVPLGWRKVSLEWDDGWWMLDFKSK